MRSLRYALLVGGSYVVIAVLWITMSTDLVAAISSTVEEQARAEKYKGWGFVFASGMWLGLITFKLFKRIENSAATIVQRTEALVAAERRVLASVMAASVAHDANNALTACMSDLDDLQRARLPTDVQGTVERLGRCLSRLAELNTRLLDAGRQRVRSHQQEVPLQRLAQEAVDVVRSHHRVKHAQVKVLLDPALTMRAQPVLVHQMLLNLVLNAAEATDGHGTVEVRGMRDGNELVLEVHDDGPGVPRERRATLFEALSTTKEHGSGLGLFSVKACAESLGGSVAVGDSPLGGACFTLRLPSTQHT